MTVDFLFWPKAALVSIYLLLNPLLSKLLTPLSADKKNSCTALKIVYYWRSRIGLFFSQSWLSFFLSIAAPFPALSIETIILDRCQTKIFEDMNIFIKILPFLHSFLLLEVAGTVVSLSVDSFSTSVLAKKNFSLYEYEATYSEVKKITLLQWKTIISGPDFVLSRLACYFNPPFEMKNNH